MGDGIVGIHIGSGGDGIPPPSRGGLARGSPLARLARVAAKVAAGRLGGLRPLAPVGLGPGGDGDAVVLSGSSRRAAWEVLGGEAPGGSAAVYALAMRAGSALVGLSPHALRTWALDYDPAPLPGLSRAGSEALAKALAFNPKGRGTAGDLARAMLAEDAAARRWPWHWWIGRAAGI